MTASMILPSLDSSGMVTTDSWRDTRVPAPRDGHEPHAAAGYHERPGCTGRHLFDVLETIRERYPDDDTTTIEFHAVLTCVRCGLIQDWRGTRDGETRSPNPIDPIPLVAGYLAAQQTKGQDTSWSRGGWDGWAVHSGGEVVGGIAYDRTPRGRVRYLGRLDTWDPGVSVEGPTPVAVLRKLHTKASTVPARAGVSTSS